MSGPFWSLMGGGDHCRPREHEEASTTSRCKGALDGAEEKGRVFRMK